MTRRGVTLIETLVVISTLSVIATVSVTTIVLMLRAEGSGLKSLNSGTSFSRLANQFRDDIHAARSVELAQDPTGPQASLVVHLPTGQNVSYTSGPGNVSRLAENTNGNVAREDFALLDGNVIFEISQTQSTATLIYQLENATPLASTVESPRRPFHVLARVSRDLRFIEPNTQEK